MAETASLNRLPLSVARRPLPVDLSATMSLAIVSCGAARRFRALTRNFPRSSSGEGSREGGRPV